MDASAALTAMSARHVDQNLSSTLRLAPATNFVETERDSFTVAMMETMLMVMVAAETARLKLDTLVLEGRLIAQITA